MAGHLKVVVRFLAGAAEVWSVNLLDTPAVRPPHLLSAVGYAAVWSGSVWVETVPDPFTIRAAAVDARMHRFSGRDGGFVTIRIPEAAARDRSLQIEIFMLIPPGPPDDAGLQNAFANDALPRQRLALITATMLRQHPDWSKVEPPAGPVPLSS